MVSTVFSGKLHFVCKRPFVRLVVIGAHYPRLNIISADPRIVIYSNFCGD